MQLFYISVKQLKQMYVLENIICTLRKLKLFLHFTI